VWGQPTEGAVGGGRKLFRGTGQEQAYQQLMQYGYFTRTQMVGISYTFGGFANAEEPPLLGGRTN
jgi:hypothetical protein